MPGTFSKVFKEATDGKTCANFLHPGLTCREALSGTFIDASIGSLKFYLPICLIPLLLNIKKWKKLKVWKKFAQDLGKCWLFGFFLNASAFTGVCCSYNLFKSFHLPTLMPLPISLSSLACFILPAHILKAEGQGLFNMYLEFLIRRLPSKLIISIRESKFAAAIIFSALHSCIMFGFLKKSSKNFWFSSFKIRDETSLNKKDSKCERIHGQLTCFRYLSQELKQSAKFAFGLAFFKLLPVVFFSRHNPKAIPKLLLKKFDYGLVMFCMSINGIFKYLFCLLNRSTKYSIEQNCVVSSLASGLGYLFYPRFIVFTMAITNAVESIYSVIQISFKENNQDIPSVMKVIDKIPVIYLMFVMTAGLTVQLRMLHPSLVNKYTYRILSVLTNGRGDRVARNLIDAFMGFK